ncbi:MAG: tetratricopeptide repeat protein, partial [Mesorhizobium sp.]|uniref:tetratricopeptide repeat protein n=1 Tax=Mesorhizobium sp. TaxID=1871066 RepID=UPI000FEA529F
VDVRRGLHIAAEARAAGDVQTAADIYDAVLEQAPDTIEAIAGLGDLLFEAGDAEGAEAVLARAPEAKKDAPPLAAVRAKMALAAQAAALGNPAELQRR